MEPLHIAFIVLAGSFLILLAIYPFVKMADERKKKKQALVAEPNTNVNFNIYDHLQFNVGDLSKWKANAVRVLDNKYLTHIETPQQKVLGVFDEIEVRYFDDDESINVLFYRRHKSGINLDQLRRFVDSIADYQNSPTFERFGQNDISHINQKDWLGRLLLSSQKNKPMPDIILHMNEGDFELSVLGLRI